MHYFGEMVTDHSSSSMLDNILKTRPVAISEIAIEYTPGSIQAVYIIPQ